MVKIFVVFVGRNCDLHAVTRYLLPRGPYCKLLTNEVP